MIELQPHQQKIAEKRYFQNGEKTWEELVERVFNAVMAPDLDRVASLAELPAYYAKIDLRDCKDILLQRKFLFNTPTWINAGLEGKRTLSACFVGELHDTMLGPGGILECSKWFGAVQKFGGGCIGGDNIIITNRGPMSLKDIVSNKDHEVQVLSYDSKTMETRYARVSDWHTMPTTGDKVFEITFRNNKGQVQNTMIASDWHPFFVFDGEKIIEVRADKLESGMAIIGSTQSPDNDMDYYSWLLGYLVGDGAFDKTNHGTSYRVRVVDNNEKAIHRMTCITKGKYQKSPDRRYQIPMWESSIHGHKAEKISKEFNGPVNSHTKYIPDSIWKGTATQRFCFLVGYLDADGWFEKKKQRFECFTVSEKLSTDIIALAGSLGIHTTVRYRKAKKINESDGYEIHFARNQVFTDAISSFSTKYDPKEVNWTKGIIRLSHKFKETLREKGIDTFTKAAWRNGLMIGRRFTSLSYWLQHGYSSRETAANILHICGKPELSRAVSSCQIVDSIRCTNNDEVLYDLTIPETQTYLASSPGIGAFIVVHNTGIDLSELRPKGEPIKSTHGKACGPIMVLKYLATTSQMITQGGARDGANMAVMSVYHKDIIDFITCKSTESKYLLELPREIAQQKLNSGEWNKGQADEYIEYCRKAGVFQLFNVSVAVDTKFMEAVEAYTHDIMGMPSKVYNMGPNGELQPWTHVLPCGKSITQVWELILNSAWSSGDPGLLFMDRAQEFAKFHSPYIPQATNPCGEQFLAAHSSCNLGSIDLSKFVQQLSGNANTVSWGALERCIRLCVRMLDNVVTINKHAVPEIERVNNEERRLGLGIMGWADMLFKLGIRYDSDEAIDLAEQVASFLKYKSHAASIELAKERGAFPLFEKTLNITFNENILGPAVDHPIMPDEPRRNATLTTVAPTGTISLMAGCLVGETLIHTLDGQYPIKDLVGTAPYVYGVKDGKPVVAKAKKVWLSKTNEPIYKVNFDNDTSLTGTKDHLVRLSNGSWKPLGDLKFLDSVTAFYKCINTLGRVELGITGSRRHHLEQRLVAEMNVGRRLKKNEVAHHINENKLDNSPRNIQVVTKTQHGLIHGAKKLIAHSRNNKGKTFEIIYGEDKAKDIKDQWKLNRCGSLMSRKWAPEQKKKISDGLKKYYANHKVRSVEYVGTADVYDMEVPGPDSFVANGIIVHNCSSGIEPHFMLGYEHQGLREHGGLGLIFASDTLSKAVDDIFTRNSSQSNSQLLENGSRELKARFGWKPANEISIEWHIKHQAAWQKYIDNSISKTLNLPNSSTKEDIGKAYLLSCASGCKGSTIYRDGCKPFQVLNAPTPENKPIVDPKPVQAVQEPNKTVLAGEPLRRKRDKLVHGVTIKIKTSDGSLYVTVNRGIRDEPFEVFATVGKAGGKAHAYTEALGRLISLALQYNIPCEDIIRELRGISSGDPVGFGQARVLSVPDGIGQALQEFLDYENTGEPEELVLERDMIQAINQTRMVDACPECGSDLFKEEGCKGGKCIICGFSKC